MGKQTLYKFTFVFLRLVPIARKGLEVGSLYVMKLQLKPKVSLHPKVTQTVQTQCYQSKIKKWKASPKIQMAQKYKCPKNTVL